MTYPTSYCERCQPVVEAEREERLAEQRKRSNRTYNQKRDPKYLRFYASPEWKRLSKSKMQNANYRCEGCGSIATEVHHVKPIQTSEGWELRFAWDNLQAVCLTCHNNAHKRFVKRGNQ